MFCIALGLATAYASGSRVRGDENPQPFPVFNVNIDEPSQNYASIASLARVEQLESTF
jgi:hypothetical protein